MSSRPPVAAPGVFRHDDDRKRDEARIAAMENQLDEVRRMTRELLSRQARFEEGFKQYEGTAAQNRLALEQIRQEAHQTAQARALDENRTRQHLGDMEARLDDATRPIRSLQAHVTELLEASRKKVDDSGQHQKRYDELRGLIEHNTAHIDRTAVVSHQLRDVIDLVRSELDGLRRDMLRTEDAIKIVDQEARRRIAEVAQTGDNVGARIDEIRSDLAHLFDLIEDTRRSIVHIDPALETLREIDVVMRQDLTRFQSQAIERHELLLERAEDTRQEVDARFDDIRQAIEQRAERLAERIEGSQDQDRDLAFKISTLSGQLDELRQVDASLRRDIWYLHEQRVRLRFEQIQQELDIVTGQRRDAETTHGNGGAPEPRALRRPAVSDLDH
jgi:chromosome segregation ATPase